MVQGIGDALAAGFAVMLGIGIFCTVLFFNIVLLVMKLCGVLLLSWWWIGLMTPVTVAVIFIVLIVIAGFKSIFG